MIKTKQNNMAQYEFVKGCSNEVNTLECLKDEGHTHTPPHPL